MGGGVRPRLRNAVKDALYRMPAPVSKRHARVVVLCYHSVHPSNSNACETPASFEDHLRWLAEHCTVVAFDEVQRYAAEPAGERPVVALTFDDGFADNHEHALPALLRHGLPATFFVTTGFVAGGREGVDRMAAVWGVDPAETTPLTWSQVRELRDAGMQIGAHTVTHPVLADCTAGAARQELRDSKRALEDELGTDVPAMAYPFGKPRWHFTATTVNIAAGCGYRLAASAAGRGVQPGDDPLTVPRIFAARDTRASLRAKVVGNLDPLAWVQERLPRTAARVVRPEDFAH